MKFNELGTTKNKFVYEFEYSQKTNTPEDFYSQVRCAFAWQTGESLSNWVESYAAFENPNPNCVIRLRRALTGILFECIKEPYHIEYYLHNKYEFVLKWEGGIGFCRGYLKEGGAEKKLKKIKKFFKKVLDK